MEEKPNALRLAAELEACPSINYKTHAAELRRLHAENFALAAGQCMNVVGDESGTPICAKAAQLQAARERDNISFKQLLAQRDALLDALRRVMRHIPADAGGASLSDDMHRARKAIAQAEY